MTMEKLPIVREIMTTNLVTIDPEMDIFFAIALLLKHKISGAPVVKVVDQKKHLLGILTEKDCMSIIANGAFYDLPSGKVSSYMSEVVVTIDPEQDLFAVADIFIRNNYRRLPVLENNFLIGIISRRDVLDSSRKLWQNQHAPDAPDPGYVNDRLKSKLGDGGITHIHKKIN